MRTFQRSKIGSVKFCLLSLLSVVLLLGLSGCAKKNMITVSDGKGGFIQVEDKSADNATKGDVGSDVCKEFSADFVYSATGKTIVKVEPDWFAPKFACRYYFTYDEHFYKDAKGTPANPGGLHIFMMLENLNVANQKKADEFLGLKDKSDPRIKMENIVSYRENGSLYGIRLVINPDRYLRMNTNKGITDDELIQFAAKVAEKIQGTLSFNIKSNPIVLEEEKKAVSQQAVAGAFLDNLANLKIDEALKMMDADDNTKQAWGVNFNTIESLKVNKIEEAFKEEWTSTRQSFKAELDVKVKPAGEQMGWENGNNFRWITLEKNKSGVWLVHELANNP
jgi:hypothetical protein